mmetsp:Transcript_67279/g.117161  ORF Transcript_67279/g.117161 Transcript_67279/m.117161 type:complete len:123 (+) Transcript_67279:62-430(+)
MRNVTTYHKIPRFDPFSNTWSVIHTELLNVHKHNPYQLTTEKHPMIVQLKPEKQAFTMSANVSMSFWSSCGTSIMRLHKKQFMALMATKAINPGIQPHLAIAFERSKAPMPMTTAMYVIMQV